MLIPAAIWNAIGILAVVAPAVIAWIAFDLSQLPSRKVAASERIEREASEILSV